MKPMLTPRPGKAERRTRALLGSLCLFLSAVEYLIPKPLPFMRIGLANLPLLLALDIFGPRDFFLLALLKVIGQGIISASLFSYVFLFSLAGTFASAALMYGMRRIMGTKHVGFTGIGCAGAMLSNGVQLLLARYFVFGTGLRFLVPPFLVSGFISGIGLGLFCEAFCRRSQWYAQHTGSGQAGDSGAALAGVSKAGGASTEKPAVVPVPQAGPKTAEAHRSLRRQRWNDRFNSDELCIAGLLMAMFFLFSPSTLLRIPQFVFFCFLAWLSGKKYNPLISALIMAGIVFCNLLAPYGKILAAWGPLRITQGSLIGGLGRAVTLEGLVMLSGACVKPDIRLPGGLGNLLGESFRILEQMRERRAVFHRGHIIEGIDRLLLELEAAPEGPGVPPERPGRNAKSLLLLAGMTALTAVLGPAAIRILPKSFILSP
jgi:heptaprenyl diphosphate synthase